MVGLVVANLINPGSNPGIAPRWSDTQCEQADISPYILNLTRLMKTEMSETEKSRGVSHIGE